METSSLLRARQRVTAAEELGLKDVLDAGLAALHDVSRWSRAALMAVDPRTILPVAAVVEGFEPDACGPFWDLELVAPGYNKFADLARRGDPVGTLSDATDGDLRRAPIFRDLYAGIGAGDELRAAFVLGSSCWGVVSLVREASDGFFTDGEVDAVRRLRRHIAAALRQAVVRSERGSATSTATVVVDAANGVAHATVDARTLLDDIRGVQHLSLAESCAIPSMLLGLVTRARFNPAGVQITTRVRGLSGRWVRISAARTEPDDGHVVLQLEPARPIDLVPMILESFGLTERETDIVSYLARGLSSREIASELNLSPHTVRDHVKAILHKCDAPSRGELVARLFAEHVRPGFEESVHRATPGALAG